MTRSPVSVVVPFAGDAAAAERMLSAVGRLQLGPGDELVIADNSRQSVVTAVADPEVKVIAARSEWSSYYARNRGAEVASGQWLLFIDSDCIPPADLIDRYLRGPLPERCGAVAGGVAVETAAKAIAARYLRSRGDGDGGPAAPGFPPAGIAANLLVSRAAWESLGGFQEGVRAGADLDLCWRLQEAGWKLADRPEAALVRGRPQTVRGLRRAARRTAAGRFWLNRTYTGSFPRPSLVRPLARGAAGAVGSALTLRFERAAFNGIDAALALARWRGYLLGDNRAEPGEGSPERAVRGGERRLVLMTDAFPARSETFVYKEVEALAEDGLGVRVESSSRPARIERRIVRSTRIDYLVDEPPPAKARALAWLLLRHPLRSWADRRLRAGLRAEEDAWPLAGIAPAARRIARCGEPHIHVHFAGGAAGHALRISRLLGITYSLVGHGYDLFQRPRNLPAKFGGAAFAVATCEYTARETRRLASYRGPIHPVILGVDAEEFKRSSPHPDDGTVAAVGRLVEKKGFAYLLEAAAMIPPARLRRLLIVGDGPLRVELLERAEELGIESRLELLDGWGAGSVGAILERADLFAMPAVIAADGDRDAMPVVVKEAMAMELPVVASDEVGLPEMIERGWGRLVPPRDPAALAAAIEELLALPPAERRAMGARARRHVIERFDIRAETAKLERLLAPLL